MLAWQMNKCSKAGCERAGRQVKGLCLRCYQAAFNRAKRAKDGNRVRAADRARYEVDPTGKQEAALRWYADNTAQACLAQALYRETHPPYARVKAWRAANPVAFMVQQANRRALKRQAPGYFTAEEWLDRLADYGGTCPCCLKRRKLTVDHIVPLAEGGTNWIWNIQPLCLRCNSAKGNRHATYYPPMELTK
jgi:5-methylcytosine-specific restriction endonuclease McrA